MVAAHQHRPRISRADIITLEDWGKSLQAESKLANCENEQALISAVLQNPDGYYGVMELVQGADFLNFMLGFVWKAFEDVINAGFQIEILTVKRALEKYERCPVRGEDLLRYLNSLYGYAPNAANIEAYAQEVRDAAIRVRIWRAVDQMNKLIQPNIPVDVLVDKCNELLFTASEQVNEADTSMFGMAKRYWEKIEAGKNGEKAHVIPTGIMPLDDKIGGFTAGEVTVLAGADKMGKTTLLLSFVRWMLRAGYSVLYFGLEMTQDEIMRILTTMETGISKKTQKLNALSDAQYADFVRTMGRIQNWKLNVFDQYPSLTPTQLRRALRKHLTQFPVDLIVIDGLWLMQADNTQLERPQAVAEITRELSAIAKNEFRLPILITHQYRDGQSGERPYLNWLSESISVRRNAQMILGMHRPRHFSDSAEDETGLYILADRNGQGAQGEYIPLIYDSEFATYKGAQRVILE